MSSLTAKYNAIKMLHQRINLIKAYLAELPPSYLTDASIPTGPSDPPLDHSLLRNISSLLSRLPLLTPPTNTTTSHPTLATATAQEQSDVHLVSLLASLTRSVAQAKEMGSKYSIVQKARVDKNQAAAMMGRGGSGVGNGGGFSSFPPGAEEAWGTPGEKGDFGGVDF